MLIFIECFSAITNEVYLRQLVKIVYFFIKWLWFKLTSGAVKGKIRASKFKYVCSQVTEVLTAELFCT